MYIFYYSKRVEIQFKFTPLLEKINNLYIKLFHPQNGMTILEGINLVIYS